MWGFRSVAGRLFHAGTYVCCWLKLFSVSAVLLLVASVGDGSVWQISILVMIHFTDLFLSVESSLSVLSYCILRNFPIHKYFSYIQCNSLSINYWRIARHMHINYYVNDRRCVCLVLSRCFNSVWTEKELWINYIKLFDFLCICLAFISLH